MSDNMAVQTVTSNAFTFLAEEEAHGDRQATEALLLTFNTDLGFFEARLLGMLRATGARVTVIGDAGVWDPDTRAVRHAGRSYHLGLCETRAAFHPKLMVLAGPKRALATVGSGNLTMGGWQYNSELLTVFKGDTDGMPTAFGDVRSLLSSLADTSALDPIATNAVTRTVDILDVLIAKSPTVDSGHRVHASWDGPLIGHLPTGPVEELYLSAAFHDPASSAVRGLINRLKPRHVKVAVQPGWTHLDPTTLHGVLTQYADSTSSTWELLRDPTSGGESTARYRHGKLIEWVTTNGERHALTGSPNLSRRALFNDVASGGNHEIAVLSTNTLSLFPGGTQIAAAEIPTLLIEDDSLAEDETAGATGPVVRVTAARTDDGERIEVHLNRMPASAVVIQVSLHSDSPDHWSSLGEIERGHRIHTFGATIPAGSRIRAATTDPATGLISLTAPVYVTDVDRILRRATPTKHASRTHRATAADLFGDDMALLDSLQSDLAAFAKDMSNAKQPAHSREPLPPSDESPDRTRGVDHAEPWLWLQDVAISHYGTSLASWLLALPQLHTTGSETEVVPWLDKINEDTEVGLEDEDTDAATEEVLEAEPTSGEAEVLDHRADQDRFKAARRKWASRAVAKAPEVSTLSRLFVLRLTLGFWSAGNWPDHDVEPFTLVRDLIGTLGTTEDRPEELRERVGALTAVALTVMGQRTDLATHDIQAHRYRETVELAGPLVISVSDEFIEEYTVGLRTGHGGALAVGHVTDTLAHVVGGDTLGALEALMQERGHTVTRPAPSQIHIHGNFSTPEQVALDAMGIVEEHTGIAVWASNAKFDWTLVAWNRPDLITITQRGPHSGTNSSRLRWRHQRLGLVGPAGVAIALKQGGPGNLPDVLPPKHVATQAARDVLAAVGIETPLPPQRLSPQ